MEAFPICRRVFIIQHTQNPFFHSHADTLSWVTLIQHVYYTENRLNTLIISVTQFQLIQYAHSRLGAGPVTPGWRVEEESFAMQPRLGIWLSLGPSSVLCS